MLIYDESQYDIAQELADASQALSCPVTLEYVSERVQLEYITSKERILPFELRRQIDDASRIILLSGRSSTFRRFHLDTLEYITSSGGRAAASICSPNLRYCRSSDNASSLSKLVADLLVQTEQATILTNSEHQQLHRLTIDLGVHPPLQTLHPIRPGQWASLPTGQTSVALIRDRSSGSVLVKGSLPERVLLHEELLLHIDESHKLSWSSSCKHVRKDVATLFTDPERSELVPNASVLAELAIGTNEFITEFSGNPSIDGKMLGTVTLGFGRNTHLGGDIVCARHSDLVICNATLFLGPTKVLDEGRWCLQRNQVYPNWRFVTPLHIRPASNLQLGPALWEASHPPQGARLSLVWRSPRAFEKQTTQVGDFETSSFVFRVVQNLSSRKQPVTLATLERSLTGTMPADALPRVITLMRNFNLIQIS